MKKFLVITVLALFLALPVFALTDSDFKADGDITVTGITLNSSTSSLVIKSGSEARTWTFNDGGFTVTNASSTSFKIYSTDANVKAIKVASTTIGCTVNDTTGAAPATIASTTEASQVFTVSLVALSSAATYNYSCGAATCDNGYEVSGTGESATCSACTVLTGAATYNTGTCGAATCISGYTLSGSGASATCLPPPAITGSSGSSGSSNQTTTTTTTETTTTTTTTTTPTPTTPATPSAYAQQWQNVLTDAATMFSGNLGSLLTAMGATRNASTETSAASKYTAPLVSGLKNVTAEIKSAITNFVNYGTPSTKILGAGERAGVINSYKTAFGRVPSTEAQWKDAIAIGNGRWPGEKSTAAEAKAAVEFKKVYKRAPDMKNPNDNAAVTVISYGLRPAIRNTNSEKAAIKSFKAIYGHAPVSALAWDIVRSIAYSGAKR